MPKRQKQKPAQLSFLSIALLSAGLIGIFLVISGVLAGAITLLYTSGYIGFNTYQYTFEAAVLLALSISIFLWFLIFRSAKISDIPKRLGFDIEKLSINRVIISLIIAVVTYFLLNSYITKLGIDGAWGISLIAAFFIFCVGVIPKWEVGVGLVIFAVIVCFEIVVALFSAITNVQVNTNVSTVFATAPIWFYVFSATIEPINEEIVFRGFLIPALVVLFNWIAVRFGIRYLSRNSGGVSIVIGALLFGFAHSAYNSTFGVEVIAAFIFGLFAGYIYRRMGSIYPGIIAHLLVNGAAVIGLLG